MYLKITSVTTNTDKSGINYKMVGFAPLSFLPTGQMVTATGRERLRAIFPDATRDVNGVPTLIKGDLLFKGAIVGEVVEGGIKGYDTVEPYSVGDREVSHITTVYFAGENPAQLAANNAGVAVIDGDVKVAPTKARSASPALS